MTTDLRQNLTARARRALASIPNFLRLPLLFVVIYLALIVAYAVLFWVSDESFKADFHGGNFGLCFWDSSYLSVVTITTLGYGEIVPTNWWGRLLVMTETISGVIAFGLFLTSAGLSFANQQNERRNDLLVAERSVAKKRCFLQLAGRLKSFVEKYDDNDGPMLMTGAQVHFFRDAGSLAYRKISQNNSELLDEVKKEGVTEKTGEKFAASLREQVRTLEVMLMFVRDDVQDLGLLASLRDHVLLLESHANEIDKTAFSNDEKERYIRTIFTHLYGSVSAAEQLLDQILARCDYQIDGSDMRYDPDPEAKYQVTPDSSFQAKFRSYFFL